MKDDKVVNYENELVKIRGINCFKLTRDQVNTLNFGSHTFEAMKILVEQGRANNYQEAFLEVANLNEAQCRAVIAFEFSGEQLVMLEDFEEYTNKAIRELVVSGRAKDYQSALPMVELLDEFQCAKMLENGLSSEQVRTTEFQAIEASIKSNPKNEAIFFKDYNATVARIQGLNFDRAMLVLEFDLSKEQVQALDIEAHIVRAAFYFKKIGCVKDFQEGLTKAKELNLNSTQVKGLSLLKLNEEQIATINFGDHTNYTILNLVNSRQKRAKNYQSAFKMVKGLNRSQSRGMRNFSLTRDQVLVPYFGEHTLTGILDIIAQGKAQNTVEAYHKLNGLQSYQVRGVTNFELSEKQVKNPLYTEEVLETMWGLHVIHPQVKVNHLYEIAMSMQDYQRKGVLEFGLRLDQVGVKIFNDKFAIQNLEYCTFSEEKLKNLEYLSSLNKETTTKRGNDDIPINVSLEEVNAVVDFGLSPEQLNTSLFKDSGRAVLKQLTQSFKDERGLIKLPLTKAQQNYVRKQFNKLLKNKNEATYKDLKEFQTLTKHFKEPKNVKRKVSSNVGEKVSSSSGTLNQKPSKKRRSH